MGKNRNQVLAVISATLLLGALAACNSNQGTTVVINPHPFPTPTSTFTPTPWPTVCPLDSDGCGGPLPIGPIVWNPISTGSSGSADSVDGQTKDVGLQSAEQQQAALDAQADVIATQFQMSFESAVQVAQLSAEVQALTANGQQMTAEDQQAVEQSAFAIAGVSSDDVNNAVTQSLQGDTTPEDDLIGKAAANLGMPSDVLRDQLLPSLGVNP